jgi:hypothetical protein
MKTEKKLYIYGKLLFVQNFHPARNFPLLRYVLSINIGKNMVRYGKIYLYLYSKSSSMK